MSDASDLQAIRIDYDERGVATITMDRPDVRNAFDAQLIGEMTDAAYGLGSDRGVRAVVLTGAGKVFSAGADLNWMRSMQEFSFDENVADARRMDEMLRALWDLPKPLIGRINGHALGGGSGLVACCDIAIAVEEASFGFTEVVLGLAPAVISPYVVRKVGRSFARSVFITGERFGAARALDAGLVHDVVDDHHLDDEIDRVITRCLQAGPAGIATAKTLPDLALAPLDEATERMPEIIAGLRASEEGQEGMAAFLERRRAAWVPEEE